MSESGMLKTVYILYLKRPAGDTGSLHLASCMNLGKLFKLLQSHLIPSLGLIIAPSQDLNR